MIKYLSKLEDQVLDGLLWLFPPKSKEDENSVTLYILDILAVLAVATFIGGTVTSAVQKRKARKSQEKMQEKARAQQAKEAMEMAKAERESRTPLPPREQQLSIQARPDTASTSSSSNRTAGNRRGKSKLRISGNVGSRYT